MSLRCLCVKVGPTTLPVRTALCGFKTAESSDTKRWGPWPLPPVGRRWPALEGGRRLGTSEVGRTGQAASTRPLLSRHDPVTCFWGAQPRPHARPHAGAWPTAPAEASLKPPQPKCPTCEERSLQMWFQPEPPPAPRPVQTPDPRDPGAVTAVTHSAGRVSSTATGNGNTRARW